MSECEGCKTDLAFSMGRAMIVRDCLSFCSKCGATIQSIDYAHTCKGGELCHRCFTEAPPSPSHKESRDDEA